MARRENYNDLYLFMLVVREGSFTAAAQRLGLAQSGVLSQHAFRHRPH